MGSEPKLRSKRELIEEFIKTYLPTISSPEETHATFEGFWNEKRDAAFSAICDEERLQSDGFASLLENYQFSGKTPLTDEVISIMLEAPGILRRRQAADRVVARMVAFVETYDEDVGEIT